ncbi:MAG: PD-(D/E)XK nuclease domain-containing protein, partial [Deltaproteobacteria bacterium]|nr:PD-(D/E)XK nuclease domain-containing protein [Deltaproteobacteria bacterium]
FLKSAITENTLSVLKIDRQGYSEEDLSLISVGHLATVPLLFHTGYLTIDKVTEVDGKDQYFFKVPNFELKDRFYKVLNECAKERLYINDLVTEAAELNKALRERDDELLTQIIGVLFHRIPAEHYEKNERLGESFFHMALLCYCSGLLEARAEEPGPVGDLDLLLITSDGLHAVIELKYAQSPDPAGPVKTLSKLVKKALSVIKKKKYGARYRLPGQEIVPIGLGVVGRGQAKAVFGDPQRDPA